MTADEAVRIAEKVAADFGDRQYHAGSADAWRMWRDNKNGARAVLAKLEKLPSKSIRWAPIPEHEPEYPWTAPWGEVFEDGLEEVARWESDAAEIQCLRYCYDNGVKFWWITHIAPAADLRRVGPEGEAHD